jgi:hypothetical protein
MPYSNDVEGVNNIKRVHNQGKAQSAPKVD